MLEPHLLLCCGKHLSAEAVSRIQEKGQACPFCSKDNFTSRPDHYLRRKIRELQVYCPKRSIGCEWVGELCIRDRHVNFYLCPLKYAFVDRPANNVKCPLTGFPMLEPHQSRCCKRHLSAEAATDLARKGEDCPFCNTPGFTSQPDQDFHSNVHERSIYCPLRSRGCKWEGKLSNMDQHVESCPRKNSPLETDLAQLSQ